jgi:histidinol dehydrogenase
MPFYPGEWVIGIGESTISVLGDYVAGKSHLLNRFSFKFF